jgi:hypothetical protein
LFNFQFLQVFHQLGNKFLPVDGLGNVVVHTGMDAFLALTYYSTGRKGNDWGAAQLIGHFMISD